MMNVVNSAIASKADVTTAASSASGKGTRSTGDDGFAKTFNSYGDGQDKGSKAASADSDDGSTSSAPSGQGKSATDAAATTGDTTDQPAATANAPSQATPAQDWQVLDPTLIGVAEEMQAEDIPVPQQTVTPDTADADLNAATDLLADLQAVIPVATKGQGTPVRNTATDQAKTDQTDAEATDADTSADDAIAENVLAALQVVPEVPVTQQTQSNTVVDPQQAVQSQVAGIGAKVDTDVLASRASGTAQDVVSDSTSTPATTSDGARTAKATATVADPVAAVHDALQHEDDASSDIETPVVSVTDSRRFVGLAPSSNAVSLATAFGKDPDWSAAMDPSAKLSNEALYASTGKVVNTLKIELNPNDLGHVTATMRMVGEELNIHLTVENSKAYKQLMSDGSSMLDSLKAHGYSVDQITVSIVNASSSTSSGQGDDTSANGRQSSDMGQAQQQQQQGGRQAGNFGRSTTDTPETIARDSSSGGSDESLAQGTAGGRTDSRPDHVYL
jgi:chemotaxis protein MotD